MIGLRHGLSRMGIRGVASTSVNDAIICRNYTVKAERQVAHFSRKNDPLTLEDIVIPVSVPVGKDYDIHNVGAELVGQLNKHNVAHALSQFPRINEIRSLAKENGITDKLFHQCFLSFRKYCTEQHPLPVDLHILFADIICGKGHVTDLFPRFLTHAHQMYPHLDSMAELKQLSDLRHPHMWYPEARAMKRRIIFHAGPTNSGKTHQALQRFKTSHSGVYCGPLKLLANEVFFKMNAEGHHCDLVTGEERRFAVSPDSPSRHLACTVEMVNTTNNFEVAVIDEIQMVRDFQRGWAWTRALLGVCADEVHVCGEPAALEIIEHLVEHCGEVVESHLYKRITPLKVVDEPLGSLENVSAGDCIVCFNRSDIFSIVSQLDQMGLEVAVIYGALPPGTKLAQAARFNDPNDPCKVLVATDAIGMGLNLSIKRIIFSSITKANLNMDGSKTVDTLPTHTALQIAGRAGRFGTKYDQGEVTCLKGSDLVVLKTIMGQNVQPIEQAGIYPTLDQVESFSYHLPRATLVNIIDVFVSLCAMDDKFFMCSMEDFRYFASLIENLPLSLKVRYAFSLSPINRNNLLTVEYLKKYARNFSRGQTNTMEWLCNSLRWPIETPKNLESLVRCEQVFDCLELYRWLGVRFPDMFPDCDGVKDMQGELDQVIQQGVKNVKVLLASMAQNAIGNKKNKSHHNFITDKRMKISKTLVKNGAVAPELMEKLKLEMKQELLREGILKSKKRITRKVDKDR